MFIALPFALSVRLSIVANKLSIFCAAMPWFFDLSLDGIRSADIDSSQEAGKRQFPPHVFNYPVC